MIKSTQKIALALAVVIMVCVILLMPEALRERIFPYDAALFAANGAFFLSLFHDIGQVISAPMDWIWEYHNHYPALYIRRHPPLLGVVESIMYSLFGISAVTAKMTIFLFSIAGTVGCFFAFLKMFKDEWIALCTTLLILTFPLSVGLETSVRADVPAMAFFAWGCYWFACYLEESEKKLRHALLATFFILCSLYTYQLFIFGVMALFFYAIIQWKSLYKRSDFYLSIILFMLLIVPLVLFNFKLGGRAVTGNVLKDYQEFVPYVSRWNFANWTHYLKVMFEDFPLPIIGLILWGLARIRVPLMKYELFFLMWWVLGYVGFSFILGKNDRYLYFFILAAFPLTVIGIRDSVQLMTRKFFAEKQIIGLTIVLMFALIAWNITGIAREKTKYVQDVDKVVQAVLSEEKSARILYHGAFENVFIFYTRKYDEDRSARVFRTAGVFRTAIGTTNHFSETDNLLDDLSKHDVNFIAMESEDLRQNKRGGIYSTFQRKLHELIQEHKDIFQDFGHFKTLYGQPHKEKEIYIKVYKVVQRTALFDRALTK